MKTLKIFAVMLLAILLQCQSTYSFEITISNPCIHPAYPSPYFYPNGMVSVDFLVDSTSSTDSKIARCKIFVIQRNTEILMYDHTIQTGNYLSTPINVMDFPNLAYNESVKIRMEVTSAWFPQLPTIKSAYAMVFKEGGSTYYYSISNGSPQLINSGFATFFNSLDCISLASSNYYTEQYKITFTLQGDFRDSIPVVDSSMCYGFSGALPCHQKRWGYKISQTDNEAKFILFVYRVRNILAQDMGFRPCPPQQATIVYHYSRKPVVANIQQLISPISPSHPIGLFYCNMLQGSRLLHYEWRDSFNIQNHQLILLADTIPYVILNANLSNINERVPPYNLRVRAHNEFGYSEWKDLRVSFGSDPPHGCPQLVTPAFGFEIMVNPIFTRSTENPGKEVNDYLMIYNPLYKTNDSLVFSIKESEDDITDVNLLEMYQAAVPHGKEFGLTDDGEEVSFTITPDKNKATLNFKEDKTEELNAVDNEVVELNADDEINISFPEDDKSHYVVLRMRTYNKAMSAAFLTTSNDNKRKEVYSRTNFSTTVIKVKPGNLNSVNLTARQECVVDMISIVTNENKHKVKKLKLISAVNKVGDVSKLIYGIDKHYAVVEKDNPCRFIFKNEVETDDDAYYYLKLFGRYSKVGQNDNAVIADIQTEKLEFKLFENTPNPFNPATKIKFQIPEAGLVKLTVYDISGREIKTLINEIKAEGNHEFNFDGSNFATGVYFYKLESGNFTDTKRMFLIK